MWHVYIVKCKDGTFYSGITTDIERRVWEHNNSPLGAKYTRGRRPVRLVYSCCLKNKSLAAKEEFRIKGLERSVKKRLIEGFLKKDK